MNSFHDWGLVRISWAGGERILGNLEIPPKIKYFIWKIFHNAFPTSENLVNEKSPIQPDCKLHACSFETSFHVFFHCQFARKLWKKVEWWKSIKVASNGKT